MIRKEALVQFDAIVDRWVAAEIASGRTRFCGNREAVARRLSGTCVGLAASTAGQRSHHRPTALRYRVRSDSTSRTRPIGRWRMICLCLTRSNTSGVLQHIQPFAFLLWLRSSAARATQSCSLAHQASPRWQPVPKRTAPCLRWRGQRRHELAPSHAYEGRHPIARFLTCGEVDYGGDAGVVVIDPPWYFDFIRPILAAATLGCRLGGHLILSVPAVGTRPSAIDDRFRPIRLAKRFGLR